MNGCRGHDSNFKKCIYFSRMQDPALMIKGKRKNMHSTRLKSGKQIRKNGKLAGKNGEAYLISL